MPYHISIFILDVYDQIVETTNEYLFVLLINKKTKNRKIEIKMMGGGFVRGDQLKIIEKGTYIIFILLQ